MKLLLVTVSPLLFSSCQDISNIDVLDRLEKDIQPGLDKTEILKYIDTLEIKGIKANASYYLKNEKEYKISDHGKDIDFDGEITVGFRSKGILNCGSFAIFYFDESGKLLRYLVDDIYC